MTAYALDSRFRGNDVALQGTPIQMTPLPAIAAICGKQLKHAILEAVGILPGDQEYG
jgi:hypothetical protein